MNSKWAYYHFYHLFTNAFPSNAQHTFEEWQKINNFFFLRKTNKNRLRSLLMTAEKSIRKANSSYRGIVGAICKWCFSIWLIPFPFTNGKLKYVVHFQRHAFRFFFCFFYLQIPATDFSVHIYFVYWVNVCSIDVCLWVDHPFSLLVLHNPSTHRETNTPCQCQS